MCVCAIFPSVVTFPFHISSSSDTHVRPDRWFRKFDSGVFHGWNVFLWAKHTGSGTSNSCSSWVTTFNS